MNKKVFKTMIVLIVVFLIALYILKIFIPEKFVMSIEISVLIDIGNYIDSHEWLYYIFGIFTSFLTYWLYLCAVCKRLYLKWYEIIIVIIVILINIATTFIDINLYSAFSIVSFILLPFLFKSSLKSVAICFTIHSFSQVLTLSIRNLPLYMTQVNSITLFLITIECYFWLLLFYIYNNYKKEKKLWDGDVHLSMEKTTNEMNSKSLKLIERLKTWKKKKQSITKELLREQKRHNLIKCKIAIRDFIVDELWVYLIIIGSVLLCSWIFNRWIKGAMFIIAHISIRIIFDKQFHFDKTAYCLTLTCAIVWFAIPITLPIATSLLSSIIIAFIICFFGYIAQDRIDLYLLQKGKETFDFKTCTKEQVIEICNQLNYSNEKQELAIMFFVDRLSNKQVWETLCKTQRNVEWDTVKQYKYRMKQDFKSVIKEKEEKE